MSDAPFRVAAARPEERIAWPESFGTRFLVTVDVEEEFDWSAPLDRMQRATTALSALPDAHRRFAGRGVAPVYLIDHPVATDPAAAPMLREMLADGRSAIGAQLHGWVNPPFDEPDAAAASYPGMLPEGQEAAKLDVLTAAIVTATGARPLAYRAGRYGIGPRTLRLLATRGYRVDSSMRSGYDYAGQGGPDFTAVGPHAFRREDMLELPLTTVFTGAARAGGARLHRGLGRYGRGAFARAGLLQRVALTPEDMPVAAAIAAIDRATADGVRLLTLSFHSPSLVPGHTPYVRDSADLAAFHDWWDRVFAHLDRRGIAPTTLAEIIAAAD